MINYFFSYSGREEYISLVNLLADKSIAKPSLLIGDPRLNLKFKEKYSEVLIDSDIFYSNLDRLNQDDSIQYLYGFFTSNGYLKYKDQILKMLDRLDQGGLFNRLDRESLVYQLTLYWINKIKNLNPDIVIITDEPHTHETFSMFTVARYLGIPILLIRQWGIFPCVYVTCISNENADIIPRSNSIKSDDVVIKYINQYFEKFKKINDGDKSIYEPNYMIHQRVGNPMRLSYIFIRIKYYVSQRKFFDLFNNICKYYYNRIRKKIVPFFHDILLIRFFTNIYLNPIKLSNFSLNRIVNQRNVSLSRKYLSSLDYITIEKIDL